MLYDNEQQRTRKASQMKRNQSKSRKPDSLDTNKKANKKKKHQPNTKGKKQVKQPVQTQQKGENLHHNNQKDIIFNTSKYELTEDEINVLTKGLKFVPSRDKVNVSDILSDIREWERRMRLREYFYGKDQEEDSQNGKEKPSSQENINLAEDSRSRNKLFIPPTKRDLALDLFIELVKEDILKGIKKSSKTNITKGEAAAIKKLMNNNDIIIRPADKGSGITVMDTDDYIKRVETDLMANDTYKEMKKDCTPAVTNKVRILVKDMF